MLISPGGEGYYDLCARFSAEAKSSFFFLFFACVDRSTELTAVILQERCARVYRFFFLLSLLATRDRFAKQIFDGRDRPRGSYNAARYTGCP